MHNDQLGPDHRGFCVNRQTRFRERESGPSKSRTASDNADKTCIIHVETIIESVATTARDAIKRFSFSFFFVIFRLLHCRGL